MYAYGTATGSAQFRASPSASRLTCTVIGEYRETARYSLSIGRGTLFLSSPPPYLPLRRYLAFSRQSCPCLPPDFILLPPHARFILQEVLIGAGADTYYRSCSRVSVSDWARGVSTTGRENGCKTKGPSEVAGPGWERGRYRSSRLVCKKQGKRGH